MRLTAFTHTLAVVALFTATAASAALVPSPLAISAQVAFNDGSDRARGLAYQEGTIRLLSNGVESSSEFFDRVSNNTNGTLLLGALMQTGDGVGLDTEMGGEAERTGDGSETRDLRGSALVRLFNASMADTFVVTFDLLVRNDVAATHGGTALDTEAFARSTLILQGPTLDTLFSSDASASTVDPDLNFERRSGATTFSFTVGPQQTTTFALSLAQMGGAFFDRDEYAVDFSSFLSLRSVDEAGAPPSAVPVPASGLLLVAGLLLMRRGRPQRPAG